MASASHKAVVEVHSHCDKTCNFAPQVTDAPHAGNTSPRKFSALVNRTATPSLYLDNVPLRLPLPELSVPALSCWWSN